MKFCSSIPIMTLICVGLTFLFVCISHMHEKYTNMQGTTPLHQVSDTVQRFSPVARTQPLAPIANDDNLFYYD